MDFNAAISAMANVRGGVQVFRKGAARIGPFVVLQFGPGDVIGREPYCNSGRAL